jgi:hypothetical protein
MFLLFFLSIFISCRNSGWGGTVQTYFYTLKIDFANRLKVFRIAESFLNHTDFCCDVSYILFCQFLFTPEIQGRVGRQIPKLPPPVPTQMYHPYQRESSHMKIKVSLLWTLFRQEITVHLV